MEEQAAFRPAHPSCLCLSCSTAMLAAMFPVIRDGTSLHLATSSLLHLFFCCFQPESPLPPSSIILGGHPLCEQAVHWWAAPTSGNDAVRAVLFQASNNRGDTPLQQVRGELRSPVPPQLSYTRVLDEVIQTNFAFVLYFFRRCFFCFCSLCFAPTEPTLLSLQVLAFCKYLNKLAC